MNRKGQILRKNRIFGRMTAVVLLATLLCGTVTAGADELDPVEETCTVTVYGGNLADGVVYSASGIPAGGSAAGFDLSSVKVKDSRYYAKGIRLSSDGSGEIIDPAGGIPVGQHDTDYVVVYGMMSDSVAYTVRYLSEDGQTEVASSETYYGKVGDSPAVASKHIDGYYPNARDLKDSKSLTNDPSKNVFTFYYKKMPQQTVSGGGYYGGYGGGGINGTSYGGGINGTSYGGGSLYGGGTAYGGGSAYSGGLAYGGGSAYPSGTNRTSTSGTSPLIPLANGGSGTEASGQGAAGGINGINSTGAAGRTGTTDSTNKTGTTGSTNKTGTTGRLGTSGTLKGANYEGLLHASGTNTTNASGINGTSVAGTIAAGAAGMNVTGIAGTNGTSIAGTNMTGVAGINGTNVAGINGTGVAGINGTNATGRNTTDAAGENRTDVAEKTSRTLGLIGGAIESVANMVTEVVTGIQGQI